MKNRAAILGLSWLLLATSSFANPAMQRVVGRTIYHPDKSRTESLSNPETRELTETTYSPDNVVTVRKVGKEREGRNLSSAVRVWLLKEAATR